MFDFLVIHRDGGLDLVWLDAADVEGFLDAEDLHQRAHGVLEDGSGRQGALRRRRDVVRALRPHRPEMRVLLNGAQRATIAYLQA